MYLTQKVLKKLQELSETLLIESESLPSDKQLKKELGSDLFDSKAKIVEAWSKKYCISKRLLSIIWRRAELAAAVGKKCQCIPWGVVTDIFKASVRKHFKLTRCGRKNIPPVIIKGKVLKTHKDIKPGGALERYYIAKIRELIKKCPDWDKLPDCAGSKKSDYF